MRVLIVDDDRELSQLLKLSLQVGFYEKAKRLAREGREVTESLEVEQFVDRAAALAHLAATPQRIDLIFTDIQTASEDGCAFLEECRSRHRDKYGAIIVLADRGHQAEIKRGLQAGAKDYLIKPFGPEELMEHVFAAWGGTPPPAEK